MKVGFALLGCGQIAQKHADVITNHLEGGSLIAVCDRLSAKAQALGERFGVPWFNNVSQMMEQQGNAIDVVNILSPSGYHCANVLELVPYGKHLCVEKPIALTLADADSMIAACERAGIYLFVVKQHRFNLPVQSLHQVLNRGRLGRLVLGSVKLRWCRPQNYYEQNSWRGSWALDGGVFANQAPHFIDLLEWLMGDVRSVFAKGVQRLAQIEAEDTGVALLQFCSGALGVIEATTAARPRNLEGSLAILGEGGAVEIGGSALNELRTWQFVAPEPEDESLMHQLTAVQPPLPTASHASYLSSVIQTLTQGTPPAVDGKAGRRSLELITAIYESIETGLEIEISGNYAHVRLGR